MTIGKRLILLLAVPLLAMVALGVLTRLQLKAIDTSSRFVGERQIPSLATLGNVSATFADLRVDLRNHVLARTDAERAAVQSALDRGDAELRALLEDYELRLVSDERDRSLLNDYRAQYRQWVDRARQIMALAAAGRSEDAAALLKDPFTVTLADRLNRASADWIRHNETLAKSANQTAVASIAQ